MKLLIDPSTLRQIADKAEAEALTKLDRERLELLETARKMRMKADQDEARGTMTEATSERVEGDPHAQVMSINLDDWRPTLH